jgi:hypothetical protein
VDRKSYVYYQSLNSPLISLINPGIRRGRHENACSFHNWDLNTNLCCEFYLSSGKSNSQQVFFSVIVFIYYLFLIIRVIRGQTILCLRQFELKSLRRSLSRFCERHRDAAARDISKSKVGV